MDMPGAIARVIEGGDLSRSEMHDVMRTISIGDPQTRNRLNCPFHFCHCFALARAVRS